MSGDTVNQRLCKVDGCPKPEFRRGYCSKHNMRMRTHGYVYDWRDRFVQEHPPKDGIAYIPLTKGRYAIVDEKWYDYLMQWKWHVGRDGYARRCVVKGTKATGRKVSFVLMHRVVNKTPTDMETDHVNGIRLDNREDNLRACSHAENCRNIGCRKNSTSKYKGVSWRTRDQKWIAVITKGDLFLHIGMFDDQEEAARAYNAKALELFGEYAKLNLI